MKLFFKISVATVLFGLIGVTLALVISPFEFVQAQRDKQRVDDLKVLSKLIERAQTSAPQSIKADKNLVYISLPDNDPDCSTWKKKGLPPLANAFSYRCSSKSKYRDINGNGWLPINLTLLSEIELKQLPVDPANGEKIKDIATGKKKILFYQYIKGSFSLGAFSERPMRLDEAYGDTGKRKAIKAVLGVDSTEVGVGGGGQMFVAGSADISAVANAPAISDIGRSVERKAVEDTLFKIEEATAKAVLDLSADQTAVAILKEVGLKTDEIPEVAKNKIEELKSESTVEFIEKTQERIKQEKEKIDIISSSEKDSEKIIAKNQDSDVGLSLKSFITEDVVSTITVESSVEVTEVTKDDVVDDEEVIEDEEIIIESKTKELKSEVEVVEKAVEDKVEKQVVIEDDIQEQEIGDLTIVKSSCSFYLLANNVKLNELPAGDKDEDNDCIVDKSEIDFFNTSPTRKDTDGDGFIDYFEVNEFGGEPIEHPFFIIKDAKIRVEILSNPLLENLLSELGYFEKDSDIFKTPAVLNPFFPDKNENGIGDIWELKLSK